MSEEDLGDRYVNPLNYLISNKEENESYLNSPILTEQSDQDKSSMSLELKSMLETLTHIINSEYRYRNSSEVFIPPLNFKDSDLPQQIYYIQDLTQALSHFMQTGKFTKPVFTSDNQDSDLEIPKPRVRKDVITKLINCQEGVTLNSDDLKQLAALLIGSARDGAKHTIEEKASVTKEKLEKKKKEFKIISEENDQVNIELEKLNLENTRLRKEIKKFKQQIGMLEKELVYSKGKCEKLTVQCNCLRDDLIFERKKIQEYIEKDSGELDLRLSVSKVFS